MAAARGQIAERGAHSALLAPANLEELRPQFAERHSLSGAFSTPALAPAGRWRDAEGSPRPSLLALLSVVEEAERPSRGPARLGDPPAPRELGLRVSAVPGCFGEFADCLF